MRRRITIWSIHTLDSAPVKESTPVTEPVSADPLSLPGNKPESTAATKPKSPSPVKKVGGRNVAGMYYFFRLQFCVRARECL